MGPALTLAARSDQNVLPEGAASERSLEWTVQAAEIAATERPPLSVAIVIDRSGSMADGNRLGFVKQAAGHVLERLDVRDRVAVVTYDDEINVVSPSVALTESVRQKLLRQVARLAPGGSTDLHGGWLAGAEQVADHMAAEGVNRILLLTDGLANCGVTDREEIIHHARGLFQRGVATSTFGVGRDFNEHLLRPMAERGGGHYYFIESPSQIPAIFEQELGELLSVVANDVRLDVEIPSGFALTVLGDLVHEASPLAASVPLASLCSRERRVLYTKLLAPPGLAGEERVVSGRLTWAAAETGEASVCAGVTLRYVGAADVAACAVAEDVREGAGRMEMEVAAAEAMVMEKRGDRRGARRHLGEAVLAYSPVLPMLDRAEYEALAERLSSGLTEDERKGRDYVAYRRRHSRE